MYIEPNSKIYICANVPLDERWDNTYLFDSKSDQIYYINNYFIATFDKYSYQRIGRGYLKVEAKADDLYGANYMTFQNTAYGNKWFFAFIKSVDYINDNVTKINYEIDPVQTWMFDWELGQCFVEREHCIDDTIGNNLIPENIDCGDYMCEFVSQPQDLQTLCITLWCTIKEDYSDTGGVLADGMFSGLYPVSKDDNGTYFTLDSAGTTACKNWIDNIPIAKLNSIQFACVSPKYFMDFSNIVSGGETVAKNTSVKKYSNTGQLVDVRNNKTKCYPYNFLYVTNNHGKSAVYPYEYFNTADCNFYINCDWTPNPTAFLYPVNYKGMSSNFDEGIELSGYPQVAFNVDAFKAWLAQSASSIGMTALAATSQLVSPKVMTDPSIPSNAVNVSELAGVATAAKVLSIIGSGVYSMIQPPQARGSQGGSIQVVSGIQNFTIIRKYVRPEFATIIDNYFDMFGYACRKVKVPNITWRLGWNYVKTVGCEISGNIPSDDIKKLKDIFDNGIRFWHQNTTIGDYTQPNNFPI